MFIEVGKVYKVGTYSIRKERSMSRGSTNKVILVGNVGADPEVRFTAGGTRVAHFSMATSEQWQDKKGKRQERTEWHRVVLWRRLAEITGQYVKKGSKVYIEGKLQTRAWEDAEGQKHYTTEIIAYNIEMLDIQGGGPAELDMSYGRGSDESAVPRGVERRVAEDDLPF